MGHLLDGAMAPVQTRRAPGPLGEAGPPRHRSAARVHLLVTFAGPWPACTNDCSQSADVSLCTYAALRALLELRALSPASRHKAHLLRCAYLFSNATRVKPGVYLVCAWAVAPSRRWYKCL